MLGRRGEEDPVECLGSKKGMGCAGDSKNEWSSEGFNVAKNATDGHGQVAENQHGWDSGRETDQGFKECSNNEVCNERAFVETCPRKRWIALTWRRGRGDALDGGQDKTWFTGC